MMEIDSVKAELDETIDRLDKAESELNCLYQCEARVAALEQRIERIDDTEKIDTPVENILDRMAILERAVVALETRAGVTRDLVYGRINDTDSRFDELAKRVAELENGGGDE